MQQKPKAGHVLNMSWCAHQHDFAHVQALDCRRKEADMEQKSGTESAALTLVDSFQGPT